MNGIMISTLTVIILVLFIGIAISFWIIEQIHTLKLEKKFENFSMLPSNEDGLSILDKSLIKIGKIINLLSKYFLKSAFLKNYAKKYDRFITTEESEVKTNMDYIVIKFIVAFLFGLISFFSLLIKYRTLNGMPTLIAFLIGFFVPDIILNIKFYQKKKQVEEDLLKAIIMMNNSFKSGKNIMQAIETVKNELDGPIQDEFKKIYLDITYGLSLDVVFNRFYERVKLEDAKYIVSSLTLLNKTGGNIIQVFASIEKSFFYKKKLREELKSLTASSIFVYRVLVFLPLIFILVIYTLNKSYFSPLFTGVGFIFLSIILFLYISYIFVIKKVLKVKM